MGWYIIRANSLLIVNVILTDGIRMNLIVLPKNRSHLQNNNFFCSGIINLLFDGLVYNTNGHFDHYSYRMLVLSSNNTKQYIFV